MLHSVLATIAGLITAGIILFFLEQLCITNFGPEQAVDSKDTNAINAAMHNAPLAFFVCLLAAYAISGFVGGWISGFIYKKNLMPAIIVAIIYFALSLMNFISFYHPTWVIIIGCIVAAVFPWLGGRVGIQKK
jgi:hypothetical protein